MPTWLEIITVGTGAIILLLVVANVLVIAVTAAVAAIVARWTSKTAKSMSDALDIPLFDKGDGNHAP